MDHTTTLAKVLGVLCVAGGLNALLNRKAMAAAMQDVVGSPASLWIWGFINLLMGAAFVALDNVWTRDWRVLIPIAGWGALVKGTWLIFLPDSAKVTYRAASSKPGVLTFGGAAAIILGVFLLWEANL